MDLKPLRYTAILSGLVVGIISLTTRGIGTFALPVYIFICIPILEMLLPHDGRNLEEEEEKEVLNNRMYDYVLYAMVPLLWGFLIFGLYSLSQPGLTGMEITGRVLSLGLALVSVGVNVGHELGHRSKSFEQILAKLLLLPNLNLHFFIEHNRGHHKRVSTYEDPATARRGEPIYLFWLRSSFYSYLSAWNLENKRLEKNGQRVFSFSNEMIRYEIYQLILIGLVYLAFGLPVTLYFIAAAIISKLFFETINYVEHYGLRRKKKENGNYERVQPAHSWNSNHWVGRLLLFELTRHSDHHYKASRKYQILRHYEEAPQMPGGYPTMILLSFFPPLWFRIMNKRIDEFKAQGVNGTSLA